MHRHGRGRPVRSQPVNGSRLCARPGCQGLVAAWLTYDYAARSVWVDDQPAKESGDRWALCGIHASRLRVPQGWAHLDRRLEPGGAVVQPPEAGSAGLSADGEAGPALAS